MYPTVQAGYTATDLGHLALKLRVAEPQAGLGLEGAYRRYRELYKSLKGWFEG